MSAKSDLIERIKRRFGWPSVKVELEEKTIENYIDYAVRKYIKFSAGNATQEVFYTVMLSGGQSFYDLHPACVEVINYYFLPTSFSGINTLFSISNFLFSDSNLGLISGNNFNLLAYHISLDFLETLSKYTPDEYSFRYHEDYNKLEIQPTPPSGCFLYGDQAFNSPGFVLLHCFFVRGGTLPNYSDVECYNNLYRKATWVEDYAFALCMETLGLVRRKFANFSAIGTQGTALDGENLVSEGREMQERLIQDLLDKEVYIGGYITTG